jgi:isoleucyl-tRNA synthetase
MKDFKDTLLMMKTDFPMRGNMGVSELPIQERWFSEKLYEKVLKKNEEKSSFVLHDGPPYANGSIHIGHALNKILKDFVVRYKTMSGYYSPYVPGWDTHGLPIESALTKDKKVNRKEMSVSDFRTACAEYAFDQIATQKEQFKRLGILGEWDTPYVTMDKEYEAVQIRAFGKMVERGLIFKGLKPVYWSPSSETALAEAEIEYQNVKSPSIYLAFKVMDGKKVVSNDCELVIWTTTPWTIPANLAIAANAESTYAVISANNRYFIVVTDLLESFAKDCEFTSFTVIKKIPGSQLEGITYVHPLYGRISPVVLSDHVTVEVGTGLVHIAPGHGEDDFIVGRKYGLEVLCPIDSKGFMTDESGEFSGLFYEEANKAIVKRLEEEQALLKMLWVTHTYPHDWRTNKPVIFRATQQWFASIEGFKADMLQAVSKIEWHPTWGETRISNMIKDRHEWCISRQRAWGVPIPVFYAEDGSEILDQELIEHVADLFEAQGSNIWFDKTAQELLPEGYTHPKSPNGIFTKESDIMDVWFDSGVSHQAVLVKRGLPYPAALYLEGSDQYRGWFNSSLSIGVAITRKSPYQIIVSHGFVLDGEGRKMSKSLGNVIDPNTITKEYGADVLRMWVASVDYQSDVRISKDVIKQTSEAYRKIRNTFRFLLGNVFDFDPTKDAISYDRLPEIDQYMMVKLNKLMEDVENSYHNYAFDEVGRMILNYMTNELSAFYLDFTKDILYIEASENFERRSIQTGFFAHLEALTRLLTPIIPHTTEEVYSFMPGEKAESIYLCDMPTTIKYANANELLEKYEAFMVVRNDVLKALEVARNEKVIGKSLVAELLIHPTPKTAKLLASVKVNLQKVFIVSKCKIVDYSVNGLKLDSGEILVKAYVGHTCSRCWQVVDAVNEDELCNRCYEVINK